MYDDRLQKLAEIQVAQVLGLSLRDLTGDGKDEVLAWDESRPGSGEWHRRLRTYSYFRDRFEQVWEGSLHDQSSSFVNEREIQILPAKDSPAWIVVTLTTQKAAQYPDGQTPVTGARHPNALTQYLWNPSSRRFELEGGS